VLSPCDSIWKDNSIRIGDALATSYVDRLNAEGLSELAAAAGDAKGEPGGAGREESDKHFAWRFSNSAGRSVYVSADPEAKLRVVQGAIFDSFTDGEVILADVPSGSGAGSLGILSSIYELRKAGLAATLPIRVKIVAGDFSERAGEHFDALFASLQDVFSTQGIYMFLERVHWDANDLGTAAALVDRVVDKAEGADRIFLLVSNFSDALKDRGLRSKFEHFVSQFTSRVKGRPNSLVWIEPNSGEARELLPKVDSWVKAVLSWFGIGEKSRVLSVQYEMCDPLTSRVFGTGVVVLRCSAEGLPW